MDTLREPFWDSGIDAYDPAEDDIGHEAPPQQIGQDERRMQVRAYNHWASLLGDRPFPQIGDLEAGELPDFDPYSVLLDFSNGIENPAVRYLGAAIAEESGCQGTIVRRLADVPGRSLLSRITDHYMQIIANQAPIGFEAEFVNDRGRTILYRGILLPFSGSADSTGIDLIYGVINWKELADQQTTDALMQEIEQALQPRALRRRYPEASPLAAWADGPSEPAWPTEDEDGVLDLATLGIDLQYADREDILPQRAAGEPAATEPAATWGETGEEGLADLLASARELAHVAHMAEDRSRKALYAAIGRAHDFALAAVIDPEGFRELVADAGLTLQERAPLVPLVKLVFGATYDKTRLTEYATVIGHARRIGLSAGTLAGFLATTEGGLKGVVQQERSLRRAEKGAEQTARATRHEAVTQRLRALPTRPLSALDPVGDEFALVLARRTPAGEVVLVGEVVDDLPLLERAARSVLS